MADIVGTADRDTIEGTNGNDRIFAGDGDDFVMAMDGDDEVRGEGGNDGVAGGVGADSIYGGAGDDMILGQAGNDLLRGELGRDTIIGGLGNDDLDGGDGDDTIDGDDSFVSMAGDNNDTLSGGAGNDILHSQGGADLVLGGDGADQLAGGAGSDIVDGGDGNDVISGFGEEGYGFDFDRDTVIGGAGNDNITAGYGDTVDGGSDTDNLFLSLFYGATAGVSADFGQLANNGTVTIAGASITNIEYVNGLILTNFADNVVGGVIPPGFDGISISGVGGDDTLSGTIGVDFISGGEGNDTIYGGTGRNPNVYPSVDRLYAEAGNDKIFVTGNDGALVSGGSGNDSIYGSVAYDELVGDAGDDLIDGGGGNDGMNGGAGMDLMTGGDGNDFLIGESESDTLSGQAGNDTLDGGTGEDVLDGGAGDDVIYVDVARNPANPNSNGDRVNGGDGLDTVITSVNLELVGANVEVLRAAFGTAPINLYGQVGMRIVGNDGYNVLNFNGISNSVATTLEGGRGNDQYVVQSPATVIVEAAGQGNDVAFVSNSYSDFTGYTLAAGVEVETLSAVSNAAVSNLSLTGNAFTQRIIGDYGANTLADGGGNDTLTGLRGNDTYVVQSAGATIVEAAGEGNDVAVVSAAAGAASYILSSGAEVELLQAVVGTAAINITGNTFAQRIEGNAGNNVLNGGGGADTLVGFGGNDQYLVRELGSVVIEGNGGGSDTVFTTVSYNLGFNEVEVLSTVVNADTVAIDLIGNFATQTVIGNYGNNILNGGSGGADVLIGLLGNDVYAAGDQSIKIVENAGEGSDTLVVFGDYQIRNGVSIEVFTAQNRGGTEALTLRGNDVSQTIIGNAGANVIDGRGGADTLVGDGGADVFAFTTALGGGNVHSIVDFASGTDKIGLASDVFAALGGSVAVGAFVLGTAAADGDDRLIYDQASGRLFYDADANGAGAAVQFAQLAAGVVLTAADFVIVAPVGDLA